MPIWVGGRSCAVRCRFTTSMPITRTSSSNLIYSQSRIESGRFLREGKPSWKRVLRQQRRRLERLEHPHFKTRWSQPLNHEGDAVAIAIEQAKPPAFRTVADGGIQFEAHVSGGASQKRKLLQRK